MKKTMKKLALYVLMTAVILNLIVGMNPAIAQGQDGSTELGQVRVIVENTTFTEPVDGEAPAWTGTLVDAMVDLDEASTMMGAVVDALETKNATQTGAESNYISEVNGLSAMDGGAMSGWMGTLNDWFTNEGFDAFTVPAGTLSAGDEIRIMYTCDYGEDLGGSWSNNDKTVKTLVVSAGAISPAFSMDQHEYTVTLPQGTESVQVTPTASNKNFQVRTCVGSSEYKRSAAIPVVDGTVITVTCGDPSWPTMNGGAYGTADSVPAETYTLTVDMPAVVDTAVLDAAKAEAALLDTTAYTEESVARLTTALALPESTQNEVDAKAAAIRTALDSMESKPGAVADNEGLKTLLLYTGFGSYQRDIEAGAFLGTPNAAYPDRPAFNQKTVLYQIDQSDLLLGNAIRFFVEPAEPGSKVTVCFGEGLTEAKVLGNNTADGATIGTNWAKCLNKPGNNSFVIKVVPPAGSQAREVVYAFDAYLSPSLSSLSLMAENRPLYLDKAFQAKERTYSTTLAETVQTVDVTAVPKDASYRITCNGKETSHVEVAGETGIDITLTVGSAETARSTTYRVSLNKKTAYDAQFELTPANATIALYNQAGVREKAGKDRCFSGLLPGTAYTFVASRNGYVAQKGVLSGPEDLTSGKRHIDLAAVPAPTTPLPVYTGDWTNFRGNAENQGITTAKTPVTAQDAYQKWAVKLGTGWSAAPTPPIIVNQNLYVASANKLYKLDRETGETLATNAAMAGNVGYALNPITYAEGMLFVPIGSGRIQAFRADTLESLWVSETIPGQTLTPLTYHNGYLYSGTWNSETKQGTYYGITVSDEDPAKPDETKLASWQLAHTGGFYWAGAYATDRAIVFGSDDGNASGQYTETAILYSVDPYTGEPIDTLEGLKGDIRSTVSYDKASDRIYFTTKGGMLYQLKLNSDGTFDRTTLRSLDLGGMSTGTPLVFNGRAYLGVAGASQFSDTGHSCKVIDTDSMTAIYSADIPGYVQTSALLSTHAFDKTGKVYVYTTYNYPPGGIHMLEDSAGQTQAKTLSLFTPVNSNYCLSSLVADANGTIYYKNDSGYLMAVSRRSAAWEPDLAALQHCINQAVENKRTVKISTDGSDVQPSVKWVRQSELTAYETAITAALQSFNAIETSQSELQQATAAMQAATEAFNSAKRNGTKSFSSGSVTPPSKSYMSLSIDKQTIGKGHVVATTQVELQAGDTAWSVLKRELEARTIPFEYSWSALYDSVYVESIAGDGEFEHGPGSGWMYQVNGWYPNYGASKYTLKNGDVMQWRYTTNLGADLGEDLSKWVIPDTQRPGNNSTGAGPTEDLPDEQAPLGSPGATTPSAIHFLDVTESDPFHTAVTKAVAMGLFKGTGTTTFSPGHPMTRAMLATVLYGMEGRPAATGGTGVFSDNPDGRWYTDAMYWASEKRLLLGYGNGLIGSNDPVTREQPAVVLHRYAAFKKQDRTAAFDLGRFTDANQIGVWARNAVGWALSAEIMSGQTPTLLVPKQATTRAEAADILVRFAETLAD